MAEISLDAYQNKIEALLQAGHYAEALAHARHILKTSPKNLRAYQQLSRALFASGLWNEAAGLLRRSLGAQPNDFETHSLLAQSYQQLNELERALWHAERALDQRPNDRPTISLLRALHRALHKEEIERLQLTASALAQQHIRNNSLPTALETLDSALERNPERIDLQLLRARALWLDGQRMEAAETATDILQKLPYALEANRIMTELWLSEQRPTDAQSYLRRIEELDPALAHQLATGAPSANLPTLEELDYSNLPQQEQIIVNPEWLERLRGADAENAETGGLDALFGLESSAPAEADATADLPGLLSAAQIEQLFSELVTGEAVAETRDLPDESEQVLAEMEQRGLFDDTEPIAVESNDSVDSAAEVDTLLDEIDFADDDNMDDFEGLGAFATQLSELDEAEESEDAAEVEDDDAAFLNSEEPGSALDDELTDLLEQLDSSDEEGDWLAEIQQGGANQAEDSLEYLDEFDREWVLQQEDDEVGGAPWLRSAMRETLDAQPDEAEPTAEAVESGEFDLFGDDEQLQSLLDDASDTEPLHLSDIEDWLKPEPEAEPEDETETDETPGPSLFETESDEQRDAALIDSWQAELADEADDEDPYVDLLSDEPAALEQSADSLPTAEAIDDESWGLEDPDQLADFVEEADSDAAPDWLNVVAPGLDRADDTATDDPNEYAQPTAGSGQEFAWVSDIVDEETGEMQAVPPEALGDALYFRFSEPPAWLALLQGGEVVAGATAHSLDIEALTWMT